ncbi:MAG: Ig-like domain-containing protein, partial [Defluviitaleaceae bacterium]|nr:Ig-like domain-containing protein [Defluviitaleaceae bacterium]
TLNYTSTTINQGQTRQLVATILPPNASDKSVTWTSSYPSVATVSSSGLVNAIRDGNATITATTVNGLTATCVVHVTED